jgi:hypothetical protein
MAKTSSMWIRQIENTVKEKFKVFIWDNPSEWECPAQGLERNQSTKKNYPAHKLSEFCDPAIWVWGQEH